MTEKLLGIRKISTGVFARSGDYYKCFSCSWRDGPRHLCPAKLYVIGCSQDLLSGKELVQLQCLYTEGCQHHLDDKGRGKTRTDTVRLTPGMTPNGICREVVKRTPPLALWAGNKSFGPVNSQAARKALSRQRLHDFSRGEDDVHSIIISQKELALEDLQKDKFERNAFHGYIHDLLLTNTGDLRSVSVYCDLGISTFAKIIERNPDTTAVIDCTGSLVRDVWISKASDMAMRSRKGNSKKQKAVSKDGTKLLYDVLNFHLAVKLRSCTFIPIEAVIVERNANTFIDILTGLKRRIRQASRTGKGEHIKYFVCDMSPPFTIAVVYVFNQGMSLPEYLATRIFALKCGKHPVLRSTIIWCSVHAERAMRGFARDKFKTRDVNLLNDMEWLFKNIHLALCRTESYEELCEMIGFIDLFTSTKYFPAVAENHASMSTKSKSTEELLTAGEDLLWQSLGGVPESASYDSLAMVQARSVQNKGYNPSHFEDAYNLKPLEKGEKMKEDIVKTPEGAEKAMNESTSEREAPNSETLEREQFKDILEGRSGIVRVVCGNYDLYIAFRQVGKTSDRARYRVYVPSLAGRNERIGGFSIWVKAFAETGEVLNECFLGGAARHYIRRNWYPHLALLCPILTGPVPVVHNTTVEVSFKNKKHHENLGLLARQRMGGMKVAEYVKLAAREAPVEAKRIRVLMESLRKDDLNPNPPRKRTESVERKANPPRKKQRTFLEEAQLTNTVKANVKLDMRVFEPKQPLSECNQTPVVPTRKGEVVPATQQSQYEASQIEEGWAKKGFKRDRDETELLELMRLKRKEYFGDWTQAEIASFLTKEFFVEHKMRIDRSAVSRIFTDKQKPTPPGKDKCDVLREIFSKLLPKRTVDSEQKLLYFKMLPIAAQRVEDLLKNPTEAQMGPHVISELGDGFIKLTDIQGLVRPEKLSGPGGRYWISDEVVNAMTSLFSLMETKQRVFFFNSLMMQKALSTQDDEQIFRLLRGNDITRKGQEWSFRESAKSFAPFLVNGNHWVGMRIDANDKTVQCVNSLHNESATHGYGNTLASFLRKVDGNTWH